MLTAKIITQNAVRPFHFWSAKELSQAMVSSKSKWTDPWWELDNPSRGQTAQSSRIDWLIRLCDGSNLCDREYASILDWLRRFIWSVFSDPRDLRGAYKPGSALHLVQGMRVLVPWLVDRGVVRPCEITRTLVEAFVDDLPDLIARVSKSAPSKSHDGAHEGIPASRFYPSLKLLDLLWRQSAALAEAGIKSLAERPWVDDGETNAIARKLSTESKGWIQPLPDEVAIRVLNRATKFLGVPAQDILSIRRQIADAMKRPLLRRSKGKTKTRGAHFYRASQVALKFEFSCLDGEREPWHQPLGQCFWGKRRAPLRELASLVVELAGAACITIHSETAMRASEVCGLDAGLDPVEGLPFNVTVKPSATGLNEIFSIRTALSKGKRTPKDEDWLLGMRPRGSQDMPAPIRAIAILDELLAPERGLAGSQRLFVSFDCQGFPTTAASVNEYTYKTINSAMRKFVAKYVDLSDLPDQSKHSLKANDLIAWKRSKGRVLRSHQLRKTYGAFVLATDPSLLPEVQRQFHHFRMAMTESGYWGNNRLQIEPLDAVASQITAMQLYEMATGKTRVAGRRGETLERHIHEVKKLVSSLSAEAGWRSVVRFVNDNRLTMWFGTLGNCMPLGGSSMECHKCAGTKPIGLRAPNFSTRTTDMCAGCACFVMDERHTGFWKKRYVDNEVAYQRALKNGCGGAFRVAKKRAAVAKVLLRRIGISADELNLLIQRGLAHEEVADVT